MAITWNRIEKAAVPTGPNESKHEIKHVAMETAQKQRICFNQTFGAGRSLKWKPLFITADHPLIISLEKRHSAVQWYHDDKLANFGALKVN